MTISKDSNDLEGYAVVNAKEVVEMLEYRPRQQITVDIIEEKS